MPREVPYRINENNIRYFWDLAIVKKDLPLFLLAQSLWIDILPNENFLRKKGYDTLVASVRSSYQERVIHKRQLEKELFEKEELLKDETKLRLQLKSEYEKDYRKYDDWQRKVYGNELVIIESYRSEAYESIPDEKKQHVLMNLLEHYFENQKEIIKQFYKDFPVEKTLEEAHFKLKEEIKEIRKNLEKAERLFAFNETLFEEVLKEWFDTTQ